MQGASVAGVAAADAAGLAAADAAAICVRRERVRGPLEWVLAGGACGGLAGSWAVPCVRAHAALAAGGVWRLASARAGVDELEGWAGGVTRVSDSESLRSSVRSDGCGRAVYPSGSGSGSGSASCAASGSEPESPGRRPVAQRAPGEADAGSRRGSGRPTRKRAKPSRAERSGSRETAQSASPPGVVAEPRARGDSGEESRADEGSEDEEVLLVDPDTGEVVGSLGADGKERLGLPDGGHGAWPPAEPRGTWTGDRSGLGGVGAAEQAGAVEYGEGEGGGRGRHEAGPDADHEGGNVEADEDEDEGEGEDEELCFMDEDEAAALLRTGQARMVMQPAVAAASGPWLERWPALGAEQPRDSRFAPHDVGSVTDTASHGLSSAGDGSTRAALLAHSARASRVASPSAASPGLLVSTEPVGAGAVGRGGAQGAQLAGAAVRWDPLAGQWVFA